MKQFLLVLVDMPEKFLIWSNIRYRLFVALTIGWFLFSPVLCTVLQYKHKNSRNNTTMHQNLQIEGVSLCQAYGIKKILILKKWKDTNWSYDFHKAWTRICIYVYQRTEFPKQASKCLGMVWIMWPDAYLVAACQVTSSLHLSTRAVSSSTCEFQFGTLTNNKRERVVM